MDIIFIEFFDCIHTKTISAHPHTNGMIIPRQGERIRFDSGEYNGLYEVVDLVYYESTKTLKIKIKEL